MGVQDIVYQLGFGMRELLLSNKLLIGMLFKQTANDFTSYPNIEDRHSIVERLRSRDIPVIETAGGDETPTEWRNAVFIGSRTSLRTITSVTPVMPTSIGISESVILLPWLPHEKGNILHEYSLAGNKSLEIYLLFWAPP